MRRPHKNFYIKFQSLSMWNTFVKCEKTKKSLTKNRKRSFLENLKGTANYAGCHMIEIFFIPNPYIIIANRPTGANVIIV